MGKKSPKPRSTDGDVRAKAQAMRLEQERSERRVRNIIIAVVSVIVAAVIAVVGWVVATSEANRPADLTQSEAAAVLGNFSDGAPVVISHKGIGVKDESLPTLTEYFDYSCPACVTAHTLFGGGLVADAQAGRYNLEIQAVSTHNAPWNYAATTGSLVVAQKAPEKWIEFHDALMAFTNSEIKAGRGQVLNALAPAAERVKVIAAEVGIPQDVIDAMPANAVDDYLQKASLKWSERAVNGADKRGTPEYVASVDGVDSKVNLTSFDPSISVDEIRAALNVK